jgi:hypothetical protein
MRSPAGQEVAQHRLRLFPRLFIVPTNSIVLVERRSIADEEALDIVGRPRW